MLSALFPQLNTNTAKKVQAKLTWKGLTIAIEYQPGDIRFNREMQVAYGYIENFIGADKEALDVYLGNKIASDRVFQIDQLKRDGSFDEHKFMLWFKDIEEAKAAFLNQMPAELFGGIVEIKLAQLEKISKVNKVIYQRRLNALFSRHRLTDSEKGFFLPMQQGLPLFAHLVDCATTAQDFLEHCLSYYHLCDVLFRLNKEDDQGLLPLRACVQESTCLRCF
jgi:hypothetical protein